MGEIVKVGGTISTHTLSAQQIPPETTPLAPIDISGRNITSKKVPIYISGENMIKLIQEGIAEIMDENMTQEEAIQLIREEMRKEKCP